MPKVNLLLNWGNGESAHEGGQARSVKAYRALNTGSKATILCSQNRQQLKLPVCVRGNDHPLQ